MLGKKSSVRALTSALKENNVSSKFYNLCFSKNPYFLVIV